MNGGQRRRHRAEVARQSRHLTCDPIHDQRAAGQAVARRQHIVQDRRAFAGSEKPERRRLRVETRRGAGIVGPGIGHARNQSVGQTDMAVRGPRCRERFEIFGGEVGEARSLFQGREEPLSHSGAPCPR
jgi:hypothetical protein